jgi:hypothetical protein
MQTTVLLFQHPSFLLFAPNNLPFKALLDAIHISSSANATWHKTPRKWWVLLDLQGILIHDTLGEMWTTCFENLILLRAPLATISLSNFPESLLSPRKELYFHFTGVTIGLFHLDGDFRPWRHVESTKQGEFLFSCIHFATMDPLLTT